MPYIRSTVKTGKVIEIEKYFSSRYQKKGSRCKKRKPTREEQKRVNNRLAEKRLRWEINANFGYGDYHVVLGYKRDRGDPYRTPEEMKKDKQRFFRNLRKEFKKKGLEMKYIHVMEVGEKGARHHHIVISRIGTRVIQDCWPHGRIHASPLDKSGQYRKLAAYLIKYGNKTVGTSKAIAGKRWTGSRNLVHPKPKKEIIKSDRWKEEPKPKKGYYLEKDTIEQGIHDENYFGFGWQRYSMVQLE